ncbi:MAG: tyrosine-type recombinase/integrase [Anaerolineales bacterium]|nr:tyrosine-type recombinase/integrase [Anaerolineales bacterium]
MGGNRPGTALTPDGLRSIFRALGAKSGLPNLSPHVLRHTFATLAIRQGASSKLVQVAGGWSSLLMVERYTQAIKPEDFQNHFATNVLAENGCRPGDSQGGRSEETKS